MAWADGRIRAPALLVATVVGIGIVASCDHDRTTAPSRAPTAAVATVDPTANPEQGCWVWPDTAVIDPLDEGGIYPYSAPRCGVNISLAWPGFVSQDGFTYTHIRGGASATPWLHFPGSLGLTPPSGWPWTITFDRAVRNVRVYTRWAEFTGGKVVVQGWGGVVLAERAIPLSPTYIPGTGTPTGIVDTLSFPDTNVYAVRIIPALDPNYPNDPGEFLAWQAQFDPPPPPPPDTLCKLSTSGTDSAAVRAFNDTTVRRAMEGMLARSDTLAEFKNRHEEVSFVYKDADGPFRVIRVPATSNQCESKFVMPLDSNIVAVIHTHPFRNGEVPLCPGAETKKYEPDLNGGGSDQDFVQKLAANVDRQVEWRNPKYYVAYIIIDLQRAWYNPPESIQRDPTNRYIFRGLNPGCKWL